jgi:hypothetical protein
MYSAFTEYSTRHLKVHNARYSYSYSGFEYCTRLLLSDQYSIATLVPDAAATVHDSLHSNGTCAEGCRMGGICDQGYCKVDSLLSDTVSIAEPRRKDPMIPCLFLELLDMNLLNIRH